MYGAKYTINYLLYYIYLQISLHMICLLNFKTTLKSILCLINYRLFEINASIRT